MTFAERVMARAASLRSAAVDFWQDGLAMATQDQQAHRLAVCGACPLSVGGWCDDTRGGCGCNLSLKVKARSAYCPLGKWFAYHDDYRPLVAPTRSLIFHVYPLRRRGDWWRWHVSQIRKHADKFNGKIVIGVVTGTETETIEDVQSAFAGIPVAEWIVRQNSPLAETLTQVELFRAVMTDDPNTIVFRSHCKGVTKQPGSVEETWARIMWDGNMDLSSVEDALASHLVACVLRSQTPLVQRKPGGWFAAGSAYWFRAKEAFERDWSWSEPNRWTIEYWPAHVFTMQESACMFHDLTPSSVLRKQYFDDHVNPEFTLWQQARGIG